MILEIINDCSSAELSLITLFIKRGLNIIHIVVPIVLMISLTINFINLMRDPDNKKLLPKVRNSAIAAAVIFFIPTLINIVMANVSDTNDFSACWNERRYSNYSVPNYLEVSDNKKNGIVQDPSDYQKGSPKPSPSPSPSSNLDEVVPTSGLDTTPGQVSGDVEVHFVNPSSRVDAIYIKAGNQSMYIDGGYKSDGTREMKYLDKIGVTKIDYYLGSHSHKNHVEAAPAIIQKYGIKTVIVGREGCTECGGKTTATQNAILTFASEQKISLSGVSFTILKPGDVFYLGGMKFTCIGPMTVNNGLSRTTTAQNSNSLVVRADYGSTSFLFPGDNCSDSTMNAIEKQYPGLLNVDVLKNPHHNGCLGGSSYQKINAKYVAFTTRKDYLPNNSCINRIKQYGATNYYIIADGLAGNVVFTSDGSNLSVKEKV